MKLFERMWCVVVFLFLAHPVFGQPEGHRPPPAKPTPAKPAPAQPAPAKPGRTTASISYNRRLERGNWASSLIWGPNHEAHGDEISREFWNTEKTFACHWQRVTFYSKPSILDSIYGTNPVSCKIFFRLRPQKMSMSGMHGTH